MKNTLCNLSGYLMSELHVPQEQRFTIFMLCAPSDRKLGRQYGVVATASSAANGACNLIGRTGSRRNYEWMWIFSKHTREVYQREQTLPLPAIYYANGDWYFVLFTSRAEVRYTSLLLAGCVCHLEPLGHYLRNTRKHGFAAILIYIRLVSKQTIT